MKNLIHTITLLAALLSATFSSMAFAEARIAAVNVPRLFALAPQAEEARQKLSIEFGEQQRELQALQARLQARKDDLTRNAATMSASQRSKEERSLLDDSKSFKRQAEDLQLELKLREKELFVALQQGIYENLVEIADREGYDMILGDGVLFAKQTVDVTDKVLARLKEVYDQSK